MLNYLNAELWRMSRRWSDRIGWVVFLLLAALTGWLWGSDVPEGVLEAFGVLLPLGLFVGAPLAAWAEGDAGRTGLLHNEVAFGLTRAQIYLGKLCAAVLAGLLLFGLTALAFLGTALPLSAQGGGEAWRGDPVLAAAAWGALGEEVLCALPRYIGAVSLGYFLTFSLRAAGAGVVIYYLYLIFGEMILAAVSFPGLGAAGTVLEALGDLLRPLLLTGPYFSGMPPAEVGQSWLVGAVWTAATTAAGLALFRRREIH